MRKLLSTFVLLAATSSLHPAAQAANCDRTCLSGMLDSYLAAVAGHDPNKAPLIPGFRQTENAVAVPLGKGAWGSITAIHKQHNRYLDAVNGQALWYGVMDEGKVPVVVMIRIKVEDKEISEAEWYISRPRQAGMQGPVEPDGSNATLYDPAYLEAHQPPVRNVTMKNRLKRNSLIGIANSYFDALTASNPELMLAKPDCFRVENGALTAGRPLAAGRTDGYNGKTNCQSGLGTFNMSLVGDRRFLVIDEEQQVAVTSAVFLRNADAYQRRCVFLELFYIDDRQLSQVYSVIWYPDPGVPVPNWEPYIGNFPLPSSFGKAR
ncbi:MAG TPA: hypothetical protein VMH83_13380 [Candidatus Acidoferrum sp.]|nr:hypothetical protein [Candidatus Acidoferrum sp.]